MRAAYVRVSVLFVLAAPLGGCASCFSDQIASGVAKLTVSSAGAVVIAVRDDTRCGFASDAVETIVEGEVGGVGRVVRRVEGCAIDLGASSRLDEDCEGATTDASGRVTVSAEEITWGTLTGDPSRPVIPRDADAVSIRFVSSLASFVARTSADSAEMRIDGALAATIGVRLARAADSGVCAVPTRNFAFEGVRLTDASIRLDSGRGDPIVELDRVAARLDAVFGVHGARANHVAGSVTVFDAPHPIDEPLLDDFDAAAHEASYACDPALARPLTFECEAPWGDVAVAVARLPTALAGRVAGVAADHCFADPSMYVVASDVAAGRRGVATKTLRAGACLLRFDGAVGAPDCFGDAPIARGVVRVEGSQTIRGRTTGDVVRPAAPESETAVSMQLDLYVEAPLAFELAPGTPTLEWSGGRLRTEVRPTMAQDPTTGLCVAPTPNARLWLESDDFAYTLDVGAVSLSGRAAIDVAARSGRGVSDENAIDGTVTLGETPHTIDGPLDPTYDPARFAASYACLDLVEGAACDLDATVIAEVARVLIAGAGHAAQLLSDDDTCPDADSPALGDIAVDGCDLEGYEDWDLLERDYDACAFDADAPVTLFESCAGTVDWAAGRFEVRGNDFVRRRLCADIESPRDLIDFIDAPHPRAPDVARVVAEQVELSDFVVGRTDALGAPIFEASFAGVVELDVTPVFGERAESPGRFDVPTPIARVDRARFERTTVALHVQGLTLVYDVEADLDAQLGVFRGAGNRLRGRITLDGVPYNLDEPFDPALTPEAQDASYSCDPRLAMTLD